MPENKTVKGRLIAFIRHLNIGQGKFESRCGLANGYVNNIRRSITPEKLQQITLQFPELNPGWLMTGEGEMLKDSSDDGREPSVDNRRLIPLYDVDTTGGFQGRVSSSNTETALIGYIQAGGWFAGRETAAIRHVGHSMVEYPDGCILVVREVLERHLLVPGKNYVIETSEYRVTKRVQRGSRPDTIALYSTNQETYSDGRLVNEPFEIEVSDIRRIFSILGYIYNQSGESRLVKV